MVRTEVSKFGDLRRQAVMKQRMYGKDTRRLAQSERAGSAKVRERAAGVKVVRPARLNPKTRGRSERGSQSSAV